MAGKILPYILVRNPRNLERLSLARKAEGYSLSKDKHMRSFYYQVEIERSNKHTHAYLKHQHDGRIISASTSESAIANRLYSNTDVSAAENIARVLSRRCLQAGIQQVHAGLDSDVIAGSQSLTKFYKALEEGGLRLGEGDFIRPTKHWEYPERDYGGDFQAQDVTEEDLKEDKKSKKTDKNSAKS